MAPQEVENRVNGLKPFTNQDLKGVNLSQRVLQGGDFQGCSFQGAKFRDANLDGSLFYRCNFDQADFRHAHLRESAFIECSFVGALLQDALMIETNLRRSILHRADLSGAMLDGASLLKAQGHFTNFAHASCYKTLFHKARFLMCHFTALKGESLQAQQADFSGSWWVGAKIDRSHLRQANFSFCDLSQASLRGSQCTEVNLFSSILNDTRLTKSNLEKAHLMHASGKATLMNGVNLREANLARTHFSESNFEASFMVQTIQTGAVFEESNFHKVIRE